MNVKEFRVGNAVQYLYPEDNEWGWHILNIEDLEDLHDDDIFKPLPITANTLSRFGFVENPNHNWDRDYKWDEWVHPSGWSCAAFNDVGWVFEGELLEESKPLLYIHQLQNLIFAVSGVEITCTLCYSIVPLRS